MTRSFNLGNLEIHEDGKVYRLNKNGKHEIKPIVKIGRASCRERV